MNSNNRVNYTFLEQPKIKYSEGIYLVKTTSQTLPNIIDHYGIMIVGKLLKKLGYSQENPLVFHLIDTGFKVDWLEIFL